MSDRSARLRAPFVRRAVPFLVFASLAVAPLAASEPAQRPVEKQFGAEIRSIEIENLAGRVELRRGGTGRVIATVHGEDSAGRSGREWTQQVDIDVEERGDRLVIRARYPTDDHRRFHYPYLDSDVTIEPEWLERLFGGIGSMTEYQGKRVKVVNRPTSGAPTVWTDFALELPEGTNVRVRNVVGAIRSTGVAGSQLLDSGSGDVDASGGRGELVADTGSGDVRVVDHEGDVSADTGSGNVEMELVRGERLHADTGSGDVFLDRCTGSLDADTGSGNVTGRGLTVGRSLRADTGSGDVELAGDFSAVRRMVIDTGSGDVTLRFSAVPSVQLEVSTGSGEIDVDVRASRVRRSRGDFVADLGDAEGTAIIDTGSGDVLLLDAE